MIKPWLFEFFTSFDRRGMADFDAAACADDFSWYLEQWTRAEQSGFEGIFFAEHHFYPGRYSPSPNLLVAAVAARTRTLRLGTMGNVVPLYEPWRLAEEYSMLDHLSGGRLEIGLASGIGPRETGLRAEDVRPRFDEALDIIDGLLLQPTITHRGRFWMLPELGIAPRPLQQPLPPRWLTGLSAQTAAQAARRGYKFCTGFLAIETIAALFGEYRQAAAAAGRTGDAYDLGLRRMVYIADDTAEASGIGEAALSGLRSIVGRDSAAPTSVADAPQPRRGGPPIADTEMISGTASDVAAQIIEQCRACGAGHFMAYAVNALTRAQAARSLELWRQVIPLLRKANLTGTA
jgi:alkanesulfonate monooxygenase SsuD/methylene tetrahydromethanopterin reductase-like flavin-dependent oxidoreductase (luciferase family)